MQPVDRATALTEYDPEFVGIVQGLPSPARVVLVDPIGVGRCYSVAAAIRSLFEKSGDSFNCLVIVPWTGALLRNWHDLLIGFGLPDVQMFDEANASEISFSDVIGGIVVASGGVLVGNEEPLWNINWDIVVIDNANAWVEDAWTREDVETFWTGADNVSLAIDLCPYLGEDDWRISNQSTDIVTRIVHRQHQKIPLDNLEVEVRDPAGEQAALQLLRARSESIDTVSPRAKAINVASIIQGMDVERFWRDESSPYYDRIMRLLLAIGQVLADQRADFIDDISEKGLRLPSEVDLAQLFGVSRVTTRRSLEELRKRGVLHRDPGGSYLKIEKIRVSDKGTGPPKETLIDEAQGRYKDTLVDVDESHRWEFPRISRRYMEAQPGTRHYLFDNRESADQTRPRAQTFWPTLESSSESTLDAPSETWRELISILADQRETNRELRTELVSLREMLTQFRKANNSRAPRNNRMKRLHEKVILELTREIQAGRPGADIQPNSKFRKQHHRVPDMSVDYYPDVIDFANKVAYEVHLYGSGKVASEERWDKMPDGWKGVNVFTVDIWQKDEVFVWSSDGEYVHINKDDWNQSP